MYVTSNWWYRFIQQKHDLFGATSQQGLECREDAFPMWTFLPGMSPSCCFMSHHRFKQTSHPNQPSLAGLCCLSKNQWNHLIDRQPTLSVIEDFNLCITYIGPTSSPFSRQPHHPRDLPARFPRDPARTPNALGLAGCCVVLILCMIHIIGVACRCEALLG